MAKFTSFACFSNGFEIQFLIHFTIILQEKNHFSCLMAILIFGTHLTNREGISNLSSYNMPSAKTCGVIKRFKVGLLPAQLRHSEGDNVCIHFLHVMPAQIVPLPFTRL